MISSLVAQFDRGQFCHDVDDAEVSRLTGKTCYLIEIANSKALSFNSFEIFNRAVFEEAAHDQVLKNRCLIARIESLKHDKGALNSWATLLASAWLSKQKSELILKKCRVEFFMKMSSVEMSQQGYLKAYESARERRKSSRLPFHRAPSEAIESLKPICLNEKTVESLESASDLFKGAVPVISSNSLFSTMQDERRLLTDKRTGRPLSDDDLLRLDLNDLSSTNLDVQALVPSLEKTLDAIIAEKKEVIAEIEAGHEKNFWRRLSSSAKSHLWADGTVLHVLEKHDLVDADGHSLSSGASCLLSKYEPNPKGDVIDFVAASIFAGGALKLVGSGGKAVAGAAIAQGSQTTLRTLRIASAMRSAVSGAKVGALAALGLDSIKKIYSACVSKTASVSATEKRAGRSEFRDAMRGLNLPESIPFDRGEIELSADSTPACKAAAEDNLVVKSGQTHGCLIEAVNSLVPVDLILPTGAVD